MLATLTIRDETTSTCIVASRGTANEGLNSKVFLPFEGDSTLAIILSKALLLADDKSIKDETILRQIFP
jgi:hypothetical protein